MTQVNPVPVTVTIGVSAKHVWLAAIVICLTVLFATGGVRFLTDRLPMSDREYARFVEENPIALPSESARAQKAQDDAMLAADLAIYESMARQ